MTIKKINNITLRQQVYEQLREKILGAELLPGEIVNLRGLAKKFGVSMLPVREAIWQLESEKILVVESNKNIQVNQLSKEEFRDLLNTRLLIEGEAIKKACRLRTEKDILRVKKTHEVMNKHIGVNHRSYIKKNDVFHHAIYSCSGSPLLLELIQRLLARVNPYVFLYSIRNMDLSNAVNSHREMFEGFSDGDADKAVAALRRDLEHAGITISTHLN